MIWNTFQWRSLKSRVTLFMLAIFVISIWLLTLYVSRMLREDMQRLLSEQQFSTATFIAAGINAELSDRLAVLEEYGARRLDPSMLGNPAALQARLEGSPVIQSLFNAGLFVTGLDGTAIASVPPTYIRLGINYGDRDFIITPIKEGKSAVGKPRVGVAVNAPIIAMSAPIRDATGKVIGVLAGVTDLTKPNFLDKVSKGGYGKTGGYMIVSPQHRLIVTASLKSRVMETLPPPGSIPTMDHFIQGYEGSAVFVNRFGIESLTSTKRIPIADWLVAVDLPTDEAFSPIRDMQQRMFLATFFLTLLAGGLIWWMLRRQLAPMLVAAQMLTDQTQSNKPPQPLPIAKQDEVGALIGGINELLETVAQREETLRDSEGRYRNLFVQAQDGLDKFFDQPMNLHLIAQLDGVIRRVNNGWETILGYDQEELVGTVFLELVHPDDKAGTIAQISKLAKGVSVLHFENRYRHKNGEFKVLTWSASISTIDQLIYAVASDITERTQMEDQVHQMAFHDALTKLPNRRLLNDRLKQSMAASRRSGHYGALMFLDLDNFKALNDAHGHEIGDLLLIEAADRLQSCVREMDTVARFGGDEFVVMISELDLNKPESTTQAGIIAEKLSAALAKPYALKVQREGRPETTVEHCCTASIGVALFSKDDASQEDILKWADKAMYQAKEVHSNLIRFYDGADT